MEITHHKIVSFLSRFNRWLVYLNLFFLQSYLVRFSMASYPSNLQEGLIALSAIVFLLLAFTSKTVLQKIKNIKHYGIILGLIFLTLISVVSTELIHQLDFFRHLKFLFFASVLSFVALETFQTSNERRKLMTCLGLGALAFGLFSALWNVLGYDLVYDYRLTGPLDSAVYLAYYLTPFFIFFMIDFFQRRQRRNLIYIALLIPLILATRSLGAVGGSFLVLSFFALKNSQIQFFKKRVFRIALIILTLALTFLVFYIKVLPALQSDSSSLGERFQIWQTAVHLLKDPSHLVFGVGLGQFEAHYIENVQQVIGQDPLDYNILQPHNLFLLFWFHFGILGLLFLMVIMWKSIKKVLMSDHLKGVSHVAALMLIYFFIHGMIDTPFFKNDLLILFILFAEMALAKENKV